MTQEKLEAQRAWRKNNPELYAEQKRRTLDSKHRKLAEDFDFFVDYTYKSLKRGAIKRGISFRLSRKQLYKFILTHTHCEVSGRKLTRITGCPNRFSVDRIDSRYGYSIKNIQAVTQLLNMSKLDTAISDYISLAMDITKHQKRKAQVD